MPNLQLTRSFLFLGLVLSLVIAACHVDSCKQHTVECEGDTLKVCIGSPAHWDTIRNCADYGTVCVEGQSGDILVEQEGDTNNPIACVIPDFDCIDIGTETCSEDDAYTVMCAEDEDGTFGIITEYQDEAPGDYCIEYTEDGIAGYSALDLKCEDGDTQCDESFEWYWYCDFGFWEGYKWCDPEQNSFCDQISETEAECS